MIYGRRHVSAVAIKLRMSQVDESGLGMTTEENRFQNGKPSFWEVTCCTFLLLPFATFSANAR